MNIFILYNNVCKIRTFFYEKSILIEGMIECNLKPYS